MQWCVPRKTSTRYAYSGSTAFDPAIDCDVVATDTLTRDSIDQPKGCNPKPSGGFIQATTTAFEPTLSAYVQDSAMNSGSFRGQEAKSVCTNDRRATSCDRYESLQAEDTDEDAIVRLLDSPSGAWSGWQIVDDGEGVTCENPPCCQAAWEIREDRQFEYKEAEWRASIEGLTPGASVTIKISVFRRAYGTIPYSILQVEEYVVSADGGGVAQATGTTLNDEGFQTYVTCTYSEPLPP